MQRFIIRYGVFTILLLMLVGIYFFASHCSIRSKLPVTLVVKDNDCCKAYVSPTKKLCYTIGDTIVINQTPCGDLSFVIVAKVNEPLSEVLLLQPIDKVNFHVNTQGNTLLSGYLFNGEDRLLQLILHKVTY